MLGRADDLKGDPENERKPGRQSNPAKIKPVTEKETEPDAGELQGVENNHARDPAARADGGNVCARIGRDMQEIASQRRDRDEEEVARPAQEVLHVVAEDEEEIEIAEEMKNAGVEEKGGQKSQAVMPTRLRWDESVVIHPRAQIGEGGEAHQHDR